MNHENMSNTELLSLIVASLNPTNDVNSVVQACFTLHKRMLLEGVEHRNVLDSPDKTRLFLRAQLKDLEHEVFAGLFLDNQHRVICYQELFRGTIDGAAVYPREVVKCALKHNAAAVIFVHNHPSGVAEPSSADRAITDRLQKALGLIDVRVLDHLVIGDEIVSFAERGYL